MASAGSFRASSINGSILGRTNSQCLRLLDNLRQQSSRTGENSCGTSLFDELNLEKLNTSGLNHLSPRYSPSFNDSEPPSYLEAIGARNNNSQLISPTSRGRQDSFQLPKIVLGGSSRLTKQPSTSSSIVSCQPVVINSEPNHRRQPAFRMYQTPLSVQSNRYSSDSDFSRVESSATGSDCSTSSIQKPYSTYLVWSVITTLYCILLGLPALVVSIKVGKYNKKGMYEKAQKSSKLAKALNIAGLFSILLYISIVSFFIIKHKKLL